MQWRKASVSQSSQYTNNLCNVANEKKEHRETFLEATSW